MRKNFLKNISIIFTICFIIVSINILMENIEAHNSTIYDKENEDLIRLHVLANSDSPEDQKVKLLVRDAIIQYLSPKLAHVTNREIAKQIVLENEAALIEISKSVLYMHGFVYPVNMEFGTFDFPIKAYGTLVLPEGKYEAVRILLGDARGANWWCVLFPPLCFIDETNMTESMPGVFEEPPQNEDKDNSIKIKFKLLELIQ
ncbi:stage II sporulation protein R [Anaerosinus massiliensis]|uniref:stage II sporulation protein R n=1 Tax=Massilibacillus massiliensis TaxID=1806837 RepID=UPI000A8A125B|nr:stage II sporulation protein R [Massilibacillus massiliensis]